MSDDFEDRLCGTIMEVLDTISWRLHLRVFVQKIFDIVKSRNRNLQIMISIIEQRSDENAATQQRCENFARIMISSRVRRQHRLDSVVQKLEAMIRSIPAKKSSFDEIVKIINDAIKLGDPRSGYDYIKDFEKVQLKAKIN